MADDVFPTSAREILLSSYDIGKFFLGYENRYPLSQNVSQNPFPSPGPVVARIGVVVM